ncbi:MAG TPA: SRPBCC domain-containing protein [Gaiellaceae bacterium]|nr:SRPBCC domain-containing protein [Gaiellaceae bacterium]
MEVTDLTLRKTITVAGPPEVAFRVFTEGLASWWPARTHSVGHERVDTIVLEGHVGGRFYERLDDGTEHDWGEITTWDPPGRLGMTWHAGRGPETAQQLEIRFVAEDDGTRVELEQTGWEVLGDEAEATRANYASGWTGVLGPYAEAVEAD